MSTLEEEIKDLTQFLEGLPRELVASGASSSYEQRLAELKRELTTGASETRRLGLGWGDACVATWRGTFDD